MSIVPAKRGRPVSRSTSSRRMASRSASSSSRNDATNVSRGWSSTSLVGSLKFDPFPAKINATLRYSETFQINPSIGTPGHYLFRCGSIFDPNLTGVGHQPYGHDTLALIYNHYEVESATITLTCTANSQAIFGITITDDASVNSDFDTVRETKGTTYAVCNNQSDAKRCQATYRKKKIFPPNSTTSTSALMNTNPTEDTYFDCWCEGVLDSLDPPTFPFIVTIVYNVKCWELKDLGNS